MKTEYQGEAIYKIVPQRYPFLMIDKIIEHEFKQHALCVKNVTLGEEVFTGHFPHKPIYPGVLLIEMGLQTTQVMLTDLNAALSGDNMTPPQGFVLKVNDFKFSCLVEPGDVLTIRSTFQSEVMGMTQAVIEIENDKGQKVAYGKVTVGQ